MISPSMNHVKMFDSIPDEQSQQVVPGSWTNHSAQWFISNEDISAHYKGDLNF